MHEPDPVIDYRDISPADWPAVEVLVEHDGQESWRPGDLMAWTRRRDSGWWGHVTYSMGPAQNYRDTFPVERIRKVE